MKKTKSGSSRGPRSERDAYDLAMYLEGDPWVAYAQPGEATRVMLGTIVADRCDCLSLPSRGKVLVTFFSFSQWRKTTIEVGPEPSDRTNARSISFGAFAARVRNLVACWEQAQTEPHHQPRARSAPGVPKPCAPITQRPVPVVTPVSVTTPDEPPAAESLAPSQDWPIPDLRQWRNGHVGRAGVWVWTKPVGDRSDDTEFVRNTARAFTPRWEEHEFSVRLAPKPTQAVIAWCRPDQAARLGNCPIAALIIDQSAAVADHEAHQLLEEAGVTLLTCFDRLHASTPTDYAAVLTEYFGKVFGGDELGSRRSAMLTKAVLTALKEWRLLVRGQLSVTSVCDFQVLKDLGHARGAWKRRRKS